MPANRNSNPPRFEHAGDSKNRECKNLFVSSAEYHVFVFIKFAIFGNFHIISDSKSLSFFESSVIPNCAYSILKSGWFRNIQSIVKFLICVCLFTILVYVSMQSSKLFIPIMWNPWWGSQAGWGRRGSISRSSYCPFWENCFALLVADWVIQVVADWEDCVCKCRAKKQDCCDAA